MSLEIALPLLQEADGGGFLSFLPMLVIMFAIFYFILIRPQAKERKAQEAMRQGLKKGDEVITQAGILARVHQIRERFVVLDLEGNTRMRVVKEAIVRRLNESDLEPAKDKAKDQANAKDQAREEKA